MDVETDYLVVGAGATGLAFADSLVDVSDRELLIVDRRERPGGHWQDAYPFVELHSPSAYYGVSSVQLGGDEIQQDGLNEGFYEQAGAGELRDYFERVLNERLLPTGRVRFLGGHEYLGSDGETHSIRRVADGSVHTVIARQALVDAKYLEPTIPATHTPAFLVDPGRRLVPPNSVPELVGEFERFTVIGAGKTSVDTCLWLLGHGVEPDSIRWVRPNDLWFIDRAGLQPRDQTAALMNGLALEAEAAAEAEDLDDMFERLEQSGRHVRIDTGTRPTRYRGTMLSLRELDLLRSIEDVVRLGRVRAIESDRIVLERGEVATDERTLHVDCSALGLRSAPSVPVFEDGRIVIQQLRHNSPTFNAALTARVLIARDDDEERNRLARPNPFPRALEDWGPMMKRTWASELAWTREPDIFEWVASTRLNLMRDVPAHASEPETSDAAMRFVSAVGPASAQIAAMEAARTA